MSQLEKIIKYANKTDLVSFILPKKCISGPNMIFIDHFLQLGNKETPYYGNDVEALIEDVAKAYQDAIRDFYDHGCRYLQIDDTSWTYLIDDNFLKKVAALGYKKEEILDWFQRVSTKALDHKPEDMMMHVLDLLNHGKY